MLNSFKAFRPSLIFSGILIYASLSHADPLTRVNSGTLTIEDGDDYFNVVLAEQSHGDVVGGKIGNRLQLIDQASVAVSGGLVNALYLSNSTSGQIYPDAYINTYIETRGASVLDVYGGRMPDNYLWAQDQSQVNMHVLSSDFTPTGGRYGHGLLTGSWADGSPFEVTLYGEETYSHISMSSDPIPSIDTVQWTTEDGGNGHYYGYVDGEFTWSEARKLANSMVHNGIHGHLTTITSAEENRFIVENLFFKGFIGGSDAEVEGDWKWVDGPESGQLFFRGQYPDPSRETIIYDYWGGNEPNEFDNTRFGFPYPGEDYVIFDTRIPAGEWTDVPGAPYTSGFHVEFSPPDAAPSLQAGDANQDLSFDQADIGIVVLANKYGTGRPATWGEGDWDGAPGGSVGNPPAGDGVFNQLDVIAALASSTYLTGPYAAVVSDGTVGDDQTSVGYDARTGEVFVDAPTGQDLTSINIDSAAGIYTGDAAQNLGGSFDNDADDNIFKATFGSSFGSISFGNVAQAGLSEDFVQNDLTVVGSLAGGGDLGEVDLVYVPEPTSALLLYLGLAIGLACVRRVGR